MDLVTANYSGNSVSVLLGNGDGTFTAGADVAAGSNPRSVALGDVDGDGVLDLVVLNVGNSMVSVLRGLGGGTFAAPVNYGINNNNANQVILADVNGDGRLDVVVAYYYGLEVLLNRGDGTFEPQLSYGGGNYALSVAAGDFNGDGRVHL